MLLSGGKAQKSFRVQVIVYSTNLISSEVWGLFKVGVSGLGFWASGFRVEP